LLKQRFTSNHIDLMTCIDPGIWTTSPRLISLTFIYFKM
jgi:hypothetical protein